MCTRILFSLLVLSSFVLSGCIGNVGEEPPKQVPQVFAGAQCLKATMPVVTRFMKGEARSEEVEGGWNCISLVVEKFSKYVGTGTSNQYTSQELSTFLEKNFLEQQGSPKISPELQLEFMKLKQIFVGGALAYVTKAELAKSQSVIATFKSLSLKLNPYMNIYIQKWKNTKGGDIQQDMKLFEEANDTVQEVTRDLANMIARNNQRYVLSDFTNLIFELSKFYREDWESVRQVRKYMPVIKKIKKAISGGDENVVAKSEWNSFFLLGARGYIQYLRFVYFIKSVPDSGTGLRLAYIARCIEDAFSIFQDLVREKPGGVVSQDELFDLLSSLSKEWPEFKISEEAVFEVMKLKKAIFGGTSDSWSTHDFENARLKVYRLKAIFESFLPYYNVYGMDWDSKIYSNSDAQKFFFEAQFNLESSAKELGLLIESNYRLEDLKSLVNELEKLYPGDSGDFEIGDNLDRYLPLVARVKNIIFSENDNLLRKENWSTFLGFAARGYSDFLYWNYFIKGTDTKNNSDISNLNLFVNQSLDIIKDVMLFKTGGTISKAEVSSLVLDLVNAEVLPSGITKESINDFSDYLLNNILISPAKRISGTKISALNQESVEYLRNEYLIWSEAERFSNDIFSKKLSWAPSEILGEIDNIAKTGTGLSQEAGVEFFRILKTPVPAIFNSQGKLRISTNVAPFYDRSTFAALNLHRAISRILHRSLTGDIQRIKSYQGFTAPEAMAAFQKLFGFFSQAGFLDPKSVSFTDSRFREANIFVPRSDGNDFASFDELVDIVGMMFSGVENERQLKVEMLKKCVPAGVVVNSDTLLKVDCVREVLYLEIPKVLTGMPELQVFLRKASKSDWNSYFMNVLKASGYVPNPRQEVRYGEVSQVPHLVQYIEMVYARFDLNKDTVISSADAMRAFPAFRGIILELAKSEIKSGTLSLSDLDDLFTFILRYGRPPTTISEKLRFVFSWKNRPQIWDVWADRVQLAKILGFIADEVAKAPKPPVKLVKQ